MLVRSSLLILVLRNFPIDWTRSLRPSIKGSKWRRRYVRRLKCVFVFEQLFSRRSNSTGVSVHIVKFSAAENKRVIIFFSKSGTLFFVYKRRRVSISTLIDMDSVIYTEDKIKYKTSSLPQGIYVSLIFYTLARKGEITLREFSLLLRHII